MAKTPQKIETDSVFFLKLLFYFLLGSCWIKYNGRLVAPIGLVLGLLFASHDHFRIDRKLEYVILLIAMALGFLGLGFFLAITY